MELVAAVDQGDRLDALTAAEAVVDFTHPGVVMDNLKWCVEQGLHAVVGTSGFDPSRLDTVRSWLTDESAATSSSPRTSGSARC